METSSEKNNYTSSYKFEKPNQTVQLPKMAIPIGIPKKRLTLVTVLEHWLIHTFYIEKIPNIFDGNQR